MSSFTPSVFTPEVMKTVSKMRADGATSEQIAQVIGSTASSVRQTLRRKRMKTTQDHRLDFTVPAATKEAFCSEAYRRGLKPRTLIRKTLVAIAKHNLFSAVLDD